MLVEQLFDTVPGEVPFEKNKEYFSLSGFYMIVVNAADAEAAIFVSHTVELMLRVLDRDMWDLSCLIVITHMDLDLSEHRGVSEVDAYGDSIDYPVIHVSVKDGTGMDELKDILLKVEELMNGPPPPPIRRIH